VMPMKQETDWVLVAVIIVAGYLVLTHLPAGLSIFVQSPQSPPAPQDPQTPPPTSNERAPTSLTVSLNTYDCYMTDWVTGTVTSNGYNYPLTVYMKHVGSGEQNNQGGLIGADGRFTQGQNINTPGVFEFWVTSGSVTSNKVTLNVHGVRIICDKTTVPFSPGPHVVNLKVYGDKNSVVVGMVNDPAHAISYPWPASVTTNAGGYATTTYDFAGKNKGNYQIDAMIKGYYASTWGADWWVEVKL
jgi:hypothetical protein